MSKNKVDMQVFEEFKEALGDNGSMKSFIYKLCNEEIYYQDDDLKYPDRGTRGWDDESYRQECKEYHVAREKMEDELFAQYGYEHLAQDGGGEGGAEDCYGVFRLGDKYYRAEYTYRSHEGCDYDYIESTLREVTPSEKLITVYN